MSNLIYWMLRLTFGQWRLLLSLVALPALIVYSGLAPSVQQRLLAEPYPGVAARAPTTFAAASLFVLTCVLLVAWAVASYHRNREGRLPAFSWSLLTAFLAGLGILATLVSTQTLLIAKPLALVASGFGIVAPLMALVEMILQPGATAAAPPPAPAAQLVAHGRSDQSATPSGIPALTPKRDLSSIAGMADLKLEIKPVLDLFRAALAGGIAPDRNGILLSGPPGNGKTSIAEAIAGDLRIPFLRVGVTDLTSMWVGEGASKITDTVSQAIAAAPCVLFLDELDAIASKRSMGAGGSSAEADRGVNTLLQQIDRLRAHPVLLVAATNHVDALDAAAIRDGRFDFRIEVPWPDFEARKGMLLSMAAKHGLAVSNEVADVCAGRWERRSAAFIENVVKRAVHHSPVATAAAMKAADRAVSRRAGNLPRSGPKVADLYLAPEVRRSVDSILARLSRWEEISAAGGTPPRGILLYGPPGTGKNTLQTAMARELGDWHVFEVKTSQILADPRSFDAVMDLAIQHRPAFVFIDEADDLLKDRAYSMNSTATNEVLKAVDGLMGKVPEIVFVAATNNAEAMDAAAKRSGRFGERIFMDRLRGDSLVDFLSHEMSRHPEWSLLPEVSPALAASLIGEAGPADVMGVMTHAVNLTFNSTGRRAVSVEDLRDAVEAVLEG